MYTVDVDVLSKVIAEDFVVAEAVLDVTVPLGPVAVATAVFVSDPEIADTGPTTHSADSPGARVLELKEHGVTKSGLSGSAIEGLETDTSPEFVTTNR